MSHSWTQPYFPQGKYNRLYRAQRIIELGNYIQTLDKLEPIMDLTQANEYLKKFKLNKEGV
jgi:hypothetical protein